MAGRHNTGNQYFSPLEKPPEDKPFDSDSNQASLQKTLRNKAETCEEKFKILDARDKLYKLMQHKIPTLKREALSATCPDMCPEKERLLREYQGRGSIFEMTNFSRNSTFNHSLAVKEYARSSADQEEPLPHELRPISVLTMTMSHLLHNVVDFCELTDDNLEEWYMFMWDRTRALRKELTQQGVCCLESVTLVEQCARFHIHCAERLVDQDSSIYDDKINTENLTKCLQTLKYMYKDLAKEDVKCPNEPEFVCYTLLLNLNNSSVFTELSDMSPSLMASQPVKFALDVMTTWETRNYIRFFDLVKETTYLNCCLLRRYFGEMRLYAIKTMIRSYCTKTYSPQMPISRFVKNLNFEGEEECLNFLAECNFNFREVEGVTVVNFNRLLFQNPQSTLRTGRAYIFIEEKKTRPLSVVLAGGVLPSKLYENHTPENSFTPNGNLKSSVLAKFDLTDDSPGATTSLFVNDKTEKGEIEGDDIPVNFVPAEEMPAVMNVFENKSRVLFEDLGASNIGKTSLSSNSLFSGQEPDLEKGIVTSTFGQNQTTSSNSFNFSVPQTTRKTIFDTTPSINPFQTNVFSNKNLNFTSAVTSDASSQQNQCPGFSFGKSLNEIKLPAVFPYVPKMEKDENQELPYFPNFRFQPVEIKEMVEDSSKPLERQDSDKREIDQRQLKLQNEEQKKIILEKEEIEKKERLREESLKAEREKREREQRQKQEERVRLELQERQLKEEREREKKAREVETRLRKMEESKRKEELDYRLKVERIMEKFKIQWKTWKTKMFFDKWRMKAWTNIEERKMKEYFREVKVKYPPVCTEEQLNSNPYGLIIPSTLVFENFHNWKRELRYENIQKRKKLLIVSDELPLLRVNLHVGKSLEARAKSFNNKITFLPWKLIISVPDESESPEFAKSIETFIEMHFVKDLNWEFGVQKGPLLCLNATYHNFQYKVSIRRIRGCDMYEGSETNPSATEGSNVIIFVLTGTGNDKTRVRIREVIKSRSLLPKVPVILFCLTDDADETHNLKERLDIELSEKSHIEQCHICPVVNGKHDVVHKLIDCLDLAASVSAPPPTYRICHLSEFFSETLLDSLWRRISISLSNFKIILDEPKVLIDFYNTCIDYLVDLFLDESNNKNTILGDEFSQPKWPRPKRTHSYGEKLKKALEEMKLSPWPAERPKSCHQLNYRIHQYCKKVVGSDKMKVKNLKWMLYRIIRRALLWKGFDIYCDEDIREILVYFPWIEVFQEISRVLSHKLKETVKEKKDFVVIYDLQKMENFNFASSLISKLLKRSKRKSFHGEDETEDSRPCLENDSVIYAYLIAVERENNKRKREESLEDSLDGMFLSPLEKRLILDENGENESIKESSRNEEYVMEEEEGRPRFDLSQIECNFQSLDQKLDKLKRQTLENESVLMEIQGQLK